MKTKLTALAASTALLCSLTSCGSSLVGKTDFNEITTSATTTAVTSTTETTTTDTTISQTSHGKGSIFDSKGHLLVSDSDDGKKRVFANDYSVSFANIITPMSDGFDANFDKILTAPDKNDGCQSIMLTIDGDVQNDIYSYMESIDLIGSVVVLRSDGSIMAEVNYPSYDPNAVADQIYNEDLAWGDTGNKAFSNYEPGSCFKIMSEVLADKHGIYSLYDDGTWDFGNDHPIVNWDHETNKNGYPVPNRTLNSAFINSSNIFFAKAFEQIGEETVLSDLSSIFHFGAEEKDVIHCDFGDLNNNIEIGDIDDLRRSAFGQAKVLTCPIFLAALGREAVFGDMVTPFVLKNVVDGSDPNQKLADGSKANDVIASIPPECRDNLLSVMGSVGSDIGIYAPEGYSFYAKTGTAEGWLGDFLYITGCAKNFNDNGSQSWESYDSYGSSGSYVIVMEIRNPAAHGFEFASQSAGVYREILNRVIGK